MKVIIPLAGKGTRLRPHTHTVPKPMLRVAGKPVMDYILDDLRRLGGVDEVLYITGHLREAVEAHVRSGYADMKATFIEQKVQNGTAGAVVLAKEYVDQPVLIIFVDTIFDADLSMLPKSTDDGVIFTKVVEDYKRFGVIVTDAGGYMTKIVEKPDTPISKRANIGLQYVRNWKLLFEGLDHVMAGPPGKSGEWYLTDAFQYMVDKGGKLKVVDVAGWYDAGEVGTLIETNRVLLEKGRATTPAMAAGSARIDPVYVEEGVKIVASTIGPNVSIQKGTTIEHSTIRDSIIGANAKIVRSTLEQSLVGDSATVSGVHGSVNVGSHGAVTSRHGG